MHKSDQMFLVVKDYQKCSCFFVVGYVLFCFAFALSPHIQMKHNAFRHAMNFSELNLVKLLCNGLEIYQAEMPSLKFRMVACDI